MADSFIVRPINRADARRMCADHPHAGTLPNSSRYYMRLDIGGRAAGLAVWGWGIVPTMTPRHLFGDACGVKDYLELCRFFVYDWCSRNTASRFLAVTHRIIRKHAPWVKWLYTYAAGFQGMVGHIYKAAGYTYIGRTHCNAFLWVPGVGLIHRIALHHRYGFGSSEPKDWQGIFPGCQQWNGYNFRYLFWLCDDAEKARLMQSARFAVCPYPTESDLEIWTEDEYNRRTPVLPADAKGVPIVKLRSKRAASIAGDAPGHQLGQGGSSPTAALPVR